MKRVLWGLAAFVWLTGGAAVAAGDEPRHEGHRRPPREAVEACSSSKAGDECSFQHDGHTVKGTCRPGPEGKPAACVPEGRGGPDHGGGGEHGGPPPKD